MIKNNEEIFADFEKNFFEWLQNRTIKELADCCVDSLESMWDLEQVFRQIKEFFLYDLLHYEPFLALPILAHFSDEENQYFAFSHVGDAVCECCDTTYPLFQVFRIGKYGFGIKTLMLSETFTQKDTVFKTLGDVISYYSHKEGSDGKTIS